MRFELDDDQALLRSSTRELLENEAALADTRAVMEEVPEFMEDRVGLIVGQEGGLPFHGSGHVSAHQTEVRTAR